MLFRLKGNKYTSRPRPCNIGEGRFYLKNKTIFSKTNKVGMKKEIIG